MILHIKKVCTKNSSFVHSHLVIHFERKRGSLIFFSGKFQENLRLKLKAQSEQLMLILFIRGCAHAFEFLFLTLQEIL